MIKTDILEKIEEIFKSDKIQEIFKKNIEKRIRMKGIYRCRYKVNKTVYRKELKKLSDNINQLQSSFKQLQPLRIPIAKKDGSGEQRRKVKQKGQ